MSADDKITDLQLPVAAVARLMKEALPNGAIAKQEAKLAITRAASVFVLFLTSGKIKNHQFLCKFTQYSLLFQPRSMPQQQRIKRPLWPGTFSAL
jgi:hypothetical protein